MPAVLRKARYVELAEQLERRIRSGEYAAGARLPSFPEMRRQGISQNTVEKAYALLEAEGLIERTTGSGVYVRRSWPVKATTIGIVGLDQPRHEAFGSHLYAMQVLAGVQQAALEHGATVVLLGDDTKNAAWEKVDGVLFNARSDDLLDKLPPSIHAVSMLNRSYRIPSVLADDERGAFEATDHLLALGHRRIGYLTVGTDEWSSRRMRGYRNALAAYGIEAEAGWVRRLHGDQSSPHFAEFITRPFDFFRDARERTEEWLLRGWDALKLTAVLAHNDQAALGMLAALRAAGRSVPGDISVVGFDGTEASDYSHPRLTTVQVPLREIGARGVQLLLEQLAQGDVTPVTELLPTRMKVGESCAPISSPT